MDLVKWGTSEKLGWTSIVERGIYLHDYFTCNLTMCSVSVNIKNIEGKAKHPGD